LRLPESEDADHASRNIGTYEIEEANESISYGANTMRDGISVSRQTREKKLVLPTEIQMSDDLQGYLRVKGQLPPAIIRLNYKDYPLMHDEFIARELDPDPLRQRVETLVDTYSDPVLASAHDDLLMTATTMPKESEYRTVKEKVPSKENDAVEFL
jgi:type IV secretory pathway TraG/TraD family ATPase VirD4